MNFYIPELKDEIKLTSDWSFDLYAEYRNETLGKALDLIAEKTNRLFDNWKVFEEHPELERWKPTIAAKVIIPKDTILIVDRIYIRNGAKEYSSITFRIKDCPNKKVNKKRFWAKLHDTRSIEFEVNK